LHQPLKPVFHPLLCGYKNITGDGNNMASRDSQYKVDQEDTPEASSWMEKNTTCSSFWLPKYSLLTSLHF